MTAFLEYIISFFFFFHFSFFPLLSTIIKCSRGKLEQLNSLNSMNSSILAIGLEVAKNAFLPTGYKNGRKVREMHRLIRKRGS